MHASFDSAGLEHPIVAERFASGAEQRQQNNCECIDQPQPITPLSRVDMERGDKLLRAMLERQSRGGFQNGVVDSAMSIPNYRRRC